jgi:hypothetical protein
LEKRIRNFLWAEKTSVAVNQETVYAPADQGGKGLLDIVARNEAIAVTWLKSYLSFGDERPLWAFVADELLAKKAQEADSNVDMEIQVNTYLQSWDTKVTELNPDLATMVKVATKHALQLDRLPIARNIQREMPIWFHQKSTASRTLFTGSQHHKEVIRCLKKTHNMYSIGDTESLTPRLKTARHKDGKNCRCTACVELRGAGCRDPNRCMRRARDMLSSSSPNGTRCSPNQKTGRRRWKMSLRSGPP